ncbi:MAG TPA: NADPH:quinone oxidoreductase family protein [Terriglobales bacterium]|nr:NADPH:quinone oxidoreductase family protein [Terriglobales bacterium]
MAVTRTGGPEVLELREMPDPQPKPGEVVVKIEAAGVNFADTMMTAGLYPGGPKPPFIPGFEFAGTVEGTGERVMGAGGTGAYAERVAAHKAALVPLPQKWSAAEGAAFLVTYLTAYFAYWMADVKPGERVLIHAAAGGVGTAAIELGKLMEVETYGTSSSDEKLAKLKKMGLDHGINYKTVDYEQAIAELTNGEGVDAVLEMLGGEHTMKSVRCLRQLGRVIVYGSATGQPPQFDFRTMLSKNASVHTLWLSPLAQRPERQEALKELMGWAAQGKLHPVVGATLPLAQAAEAHRLLLGRSNFGKVVLTP